MHDFVIWFFFIIIIYSVFPAASVLCVRAVCLRGVFAVRVCSNMKRGKKTEQAAADGENDSGSGNKSCTHINI